MAENTFLGLQPYTEADAYRFKGRTEESQELFRMIVRNDFTVCYAESGEGKTSLLNAGVFPLLRQNMYFPIAITFTSDDYERTPDSFDTIIDRCIRNSIAEYNETNKGINVEYKLCSTDFRGLDCLSTLQQALSKYSWWKLRNYKPQAMGLTFTPVFVFDQFEEVFNMPGSIVWTNTFFEWLENVSSDSCPDEIINKVREIIGNDAAFPTIKEEKDFKAVFSLRKEFIGELDYWGMQQCFIPSLKDNRYCLKALTYEGAQKVMTQQQRFEEAKVKQVLDYLVQQYSREPGKTKNKNLPVIPALLLSVVCDSWEKDINYFSDIDSNGIEQSLNKILEKFYEEAIGSVVNELPQQEDNSQAETIRAAIETAIFALVDSNGKRVRQKSSELAHLDFDAKYKEILSEKRIIKITKVDGEDYVEIVHDCLCPIVSKRKEMRLAAEAKKQEEEKLREQAQKNRKRMLLLSSIILVAFSIIGFFYYQNRKIEQSEWQIMENQARAVTEKANQLIDEGDLYTAITLCLEVLPEDLKSPDRPYVVEAEKTLRRADWELTYSVNAPIAQFVVSQYHNNDDMDFGIIPQNKYVWTSTHHRDRNLRVYDINSGALLHESIRYGDLPGKKTFSPDGNYYVTNNGYLNDECDGDEIQIWNIKDGSLLQTLKLENANNVEYFPNGKWILTAPYFSTKTSYYDAFTLNKSFDVFFWVNCDYFGGRYLFYGDSKYMGLYDMKSQSIVYGKENIGLGEWSLTAPFTHSDSLFVRIEDESVISVYDIYTGRLVHRMKLGIDKSCKEFDMALSLNNDFIAVPFCYKGTFLKVFNIKSNSNKIIKISDEEIELYRCNFKFSSPIFLLNNSNKSVISVNLETDEVKKSTLSSFYPEEEYLFVRKDETPIAQLIRLKNQKNIVPYKISQESIIKHDRYEERYYNIGNNKYYLYGYYSMPDSNYSIMLHTNEEVYIYNHQNNNHKHIYTFKREIKNYCNIDKISNSHNFALTTSDSLYIIDYKTGKFVSKYHIPHSKTQTCVSSHTGKYVFISLDDSVSYIYDILSGRKTSKLNKTPSMNITFSPSDKLLACTLGFDDDCAIAIFDVSSGKLKWMSHDVRQNGQHGNYYLKFSNDEQFVACATGDLKHNVCVFDVSTGKTIATLRGHTDEINSIDFSPQGDYLVSAAEDGKVMLWNIQEEQVVQTFYPNKGGEIVVEFEASSVIKVSYYEGVNQDYYVIKYPFCSLQEIINRNRERFMNRKLTLEERRSYYLK